MKKIKIGLIIIATNKYRSFLPNLLSDIKKFFLVNYEVEIFIFSDQKVEGATWIPCEHKSWPWMTLGRYQMFENLPQKDYYYYIDADMRIQNPIGDEILTKRLAAEHFGFKGGKGTHETNPESLAYISENQPYVYCWGAFQGGSEYLNDAKKLNDQIMKDYSKGIIATWHDESHWNKFLIDNPPTIRLPYTYSCNQKRFRPNARLYVEPKINSQYQV
jgi:histo-blood group ABO system transferase